MRKTKLFLTLILLNIAFSCSSEEEASQAQNKLVKTEKVNTNFKVDYSYNSDNLLTSCNGTYPNFSFETNLVYDSNKNLIEKHYQETGLGNYSSDTFYTYNNDGKLISYDDVILTYNDNIITATGTIEGNPNTTILMETNEMGLITKLIDSDNYTIFEYNINGNLTVARKYNSSNILLTTYNVTYDQKTNPFYGQMKSIYVERFIEFFYPFEGIYISGFEGYSFPFLKNNITSISENSIATKTYNYTYNNENCPINVNQNHPEVFQFEIEYH